MRTKEEGNSGNKSKLKNINSHNLATLLKYYYCDKKRRMEWMDNFACNRKRYIILEYL